MSVSTLIGLILLCVYNVVKSQETCNNSPCYRDCTRQCNNNFEYLCELNKTCTIQCDFGCDNNAEIMSYGNTNINCLSDACEQGFKLYNYDNSMNLDCAGVSCSSTLGYVYGGIFTMDCTGDSCDRSRLYCYGGNCNIDCHSISCNRIRIYCYPGASCVINCRGFAACNSGRLYCGFSNTCTSIGSGGGNIVPEIGALVTPSPTLATNNPTNTPTKIPTKITNNPTNNPSKIPTNIPSIMPSINPTFIPTNIPSMIPSQSPTNIPSITPSMIPSITPSFIPTNIPSITPSRTPTSTPSKMPSIVPSITPTKTPSESTHNPSITPSQSPSLLESIIKDPISLQFNTQMLLILSLLAGCLILSMMLVILIMFRKNKKLKQKMISESHSNNIQQNSINAANLKTDDANKCDNVVPFNHMEGAFHAKSSRSTDIESLFNDHTTKQETELKSKISSTISDMFDEIDTVTNKGEPELQSNVSSNVDELYIISPNALTNMKESSKGNTQSRGNV